MEKDLPKQIVNAVAVYKSPQAVIRVPEDGAKLLSRYRSADREIMIAVHLNAGMIATHIQQIGVGGEESVAFSPQDMLLTAASKRTKGIILAHNHPHQLKVRPTNQDVAVTAQIFKMLATIHIGLLDHLIIGKEHTYSMMSNGRFFMKRDLYTLVRKDIKVARSLLSCSRNASVRRFMKDQIVLKHGHRGSDLLIT